MMTKRNPPKKTKKKLRKDDKKGSNFSGLFLMPRKIFAILCWNTRRRATCLITKSIIARITVKPKSAKKQKTTKVFFTKVPIDLIDVFQDCVMFLFEDELTDPLFSVKVDFLKGYPHKVHFVDSADVLDSLYDMIEAELKEYEEPKDADTTVKLSKEDAATIDLIAEILQTNRQQVANLAIMNLFRETFVDGGKGKNQNKVLKEVLGPERLNTVKFIANHQRKEIMSLVRELVDIGANEKLRLIEEIADAETRFMNGRGGKGLFF